MPTTRAGRAAAASRCGRVRSGRRRSTTAFAGRRSCDRRSPSRPLLHVDARASAGALDGSARRRVPRRARRHGPRCRPRSAGARVVVDASKSPDVRADSRGASRRRLPCRCISCAAPQATAHSWSRFPGEAGRPARARMRRVDLVEHARRAALGARAGSLSSHPLRGLRERGRARRCGEIVGFVGEAAASSLRLTDGPCELAVAHTVAGNPVRFRYGQRADLARRGVARRALPPRDRPQLLETLSWPLRACTTAIRGPARRPRERGASDRAPLPGGHRGHARAARRRDPPRPRLRRRASSSSARSTSRLTGSSSPAAIRSGTGKTMRRVAALPPDERPRVIVWHTEPLPMPAAAGLPREPLTRASWRRSCCATAASTTTRRTAAISELARRRDRHRLAVATGAYQAYLAEHGVAAELVPLGYDADDGRLLDLERDIDVLFLGDYRDPPPAPHPAAAGARRARRARARQPLGRRRVTGASRGRSS